ncbi:MAG: MTH938/NDUFAF3 family protein [Betaproteobacteria bacterium]
MGAPNGLRGQPTGAAPRRRSGLAAGTVRRPHCGRFRGLAGPEARIGDHGHRPAPRFPAPVLRRALVEARVGFEAMDSAAACRTFNVLASEGRAVLAALILA